VTTATASAIDRRQTSGMPRTIRQLLGVGLPQPLERERDAELAEHAVGPVHRRRPQAGHVHPSPEPFLELAIGEGRHIHLRDQIPPGEFGQHARVELVGLRRQRPDRLGLACVGDLHRPAARLQLVADPRAAAHHLQARDRVTANAPDEDR